MWPWPQSSCTCMGVGRPKGVVSFTCLQAPGVSIGLSYRDKGRPLQTTCGAWLFGWWKCPGTLMGMEPEEGRAGSAMPLPRAPSLFADSLACLKSCVNFTLGPIRPSVEQFHKYLPWFLEDPPNIKCPKG